MQAGVWFKYLFGQADAIRTVAGSRAALWTGVVLVLITTVARNYDQTFLAENPFLWLFGSLAFSLVSGTWLYVIVYRAFARRYTPAEESAVEEGGWPAFMGLFWMTAPVAWLYAIPVERFLDSISATWANVALLAVVSCWRVLLMTRVMQVTTKAPFAIALVWVLLAASVEMLVLFFFGGAFSRGIISGMGGMRNSPEEEIMLEVVGTAFGMAFMLAILTLVVAVLWRPKVSLQRLACPKPEALPWRPLLIAASCWASIAIVPQRELANNVAVERLFAAGQFRAGLDYLSARSSEQFAPARALPPKAYERTFFKEFPECFGAVQSSDAAWVRAMLFAKLDVMQSHLLNRWRRRDTLETRTKAEQVEAIKDGFRWNGMEPTGVLKLIDGLQRLPEGREWLETNSIFTEAVWQAVAKPPIRSYGDAKPEAAQLADWLTLSNRFRDLYLTNITLVATNLPAAPAVP